MTTQPERNAFPSFIFNIPEMEGVEIESGLSKREYFAAMAMQGLLAGGKYIDTVVPYKAVQIADELIKELNGDENIS